MTFLKKRLSIINIIWPFYSNSKGAFVINGICSVLLKLSSVIPPIFYGIFIEKVIFAKKLEKISFVIIGYILIQLFQSAFRIGNIRLGYYIKNNLTKNLRLQILSNLLKKKKNGYDLLNSGDVKKIIEDDIEKISVFSDKQTLDYFIDLILIFFLVIILLYIDWRIAIISFLSIPVTLLLDYKVSQKERKINTILNENDSEWGTWLDSNINSFKEVRINRLENKTQKEFLHFQEVDEKYFLSWLRLWVSRTLAIPKIKDDFIMKFLLYFLGGILIYNNYFTIGTLLVFVQYYSILSETVKELSKLDADLLSNMPYIDRLLVCLCDKTGFINEGWMIPKDFNITLEKVSFGYGETKIIHNLSLTIPQGERLGIKGASGTGKSTLLKLILGELYPTYGNIKYGNIDITSINSKELYKKISYIGQDSVLFNISIRENLLLGNINVSDTDIINACKKASIWKYIESLPDGLDTIIEEKSSNLSGGQKQRLLIARALLRDSLIYIFDEPTSALDVYVEDELCNVFKLIPRNKTLIIVSHREKLFDICNRVIELDFK